MARRNVALTSNGGVASNAQTTSGNYPASGAINGNRTTSDWGAGGGWASTVTPTWWQVDFSASMTIDEVDVITYGTAGQPTLTSTDNMASYGLNDFTVQYWDGAAWQTVTTVTGNGFVWRQFTYTPFTTTKIRINCTVSADSTYRLVEVEAWGDDVRQGGTLPTL